MQTGNDSSKLSPRSKTIANEYSENDSYMKIGEVNRSNYQTEYDLEKLINLPLTYENFSISRCEGRSENIKGVLKAFASNSEHNYGFASSSKKTVQEINNELSVCTDTMVSMHGRNNGPIHGSDISKFSKYPHEEEFLLGPGNNFIPTGAKTANKEFNREEVANCIKSGDELKCLGVSYKNKLTISGYFKLNNQVYEKSQERVNNLKKSPEYNIKWPNFSNNNKAENLI